MHQISHNVVPHMMRLDARIMKLVRFFPQNTALISCRLGDGLWVSAKVCLLFISSTISPLTRVCSIVTIVESIELLTVSTTSIARNVEPTTQLILGYKSSFKLFGSQTEETQSQPSSAIPFEYCYELSPNQKTFEAPLMNLTMEGGDKYSVKNPFVFVPLEDGGTVFCLGIDKSEDVNIIGQNSS